MRDLRNEVNISPLSKWYSEIKMAISTTYANKIIDHFLTGRTSTTLPTLYLGLFTTLPTGPGNAGTEASGGSYVRLAVGTAGACLFGAAASGLATNAAQIIIPAPAATIVGTGGWDASTSGTIVWYANLQQVATSESITLASGLAAVAHIPSTNETVKNNTDSTTYTRGTDYYISNDGGVIIRIATGAITSSQVLHVTYNYPVSKTTADNDKIVGDIGNWGVQLLGAQA